jgi:ankyrin repeat protein
LTLIGTLLKANPEAAKCENEHIIHAICTYIKGDLFISLISLFLAVNKDALKGFDHWGLPIHYAAMSNTLAAVIHLLDIYPESAHMNSSNGSNILFCATDDRNKNTNIVVEKIRYLYKRFPTFLCVCNNYGSTMLIDAIKQPNYKISLLLCEMDEHEQLIRHKTIRPFPADNLSLPLHTLVQSKIRNTYYHQTDEYTFAPHRFSPVSDEADCFRLLITRYPEAAGVKDGRDISPYDLAVLLDLHPYIQRLLLRTDPTLNPHELCKCMNKLINGNILIYLFVCILLFMYTYIYVFIYLHMGICLYV